MRHYVTLVNWTDQGIRNVKDSPKRAEAFEAAVKAAGGSVKEMFLVMGAYDLLVITELPSDEAVAMLTLGTAALGNVRTTTMRAFTRQQFHDIVASLP